MLEAEIYPSFLDRKDYGRAIKQQQTGAAQKKQNEKNSSRKLVRKVHSNFTVKDIFFTGGFSDDKQPASIDECHKFVVCFLNVLKYHAKKAGAGAIKYIYVIEREEKKDGTVKYHAHIILSRNAGANTAQVCDKCGKVYTRNQHGICKKCGGKLSGIDGRDWIESKWTGGDYANTKSLQWKRGGGFTGISKYFTKQFDDLHATERAGLRHWGQSLGLKQWDKKPTESYSKFKKRRVASMVKAPATMKEIFEKEYPGYEYLEDYPCEVRYSEVIEGFYLYCRMYEADP